jgi:hypothetical protein
MEIENCNPENIEACASLLAQIYSEPEYGENWKEKEAFDYLTRFYVIEPLGCFVAVEDKELIGAFFLIRILGNRKHWFIFRSFLFHPNKEKKV